MKTTWGRLCGLAAVVAGLAGTPLRGQDTAGTNMPIPVSIVQLKAHDVVERIIGQRHELLLSLMRFAKQGREQ